MPISYVNGQYIPTDQLTLPVATDTIGTFRGYRIFTACRTVGEKVFQLEDHLARLLHSAGLIYLDLPHNKEQMRRIVEETVAKNFARSDEDILLEIMYSGGPAAPNGLAPAGLAVLYIVVFPLKLPPVRWYQEGMILATYPYQRQWPEVKLLNYVGGVIAHQTVVKKFGADEALFVSPAAERSVLEGTTFNFFVVRDGVVITYPLDGKILPGITRKVALNLARQQGIRVKESYYTYQDLKSVEEAFITSSTRNVCPVTRIDDFEIGDGQPGEVTQILGEAFEKYLASY